MHVDRDQVQQMVIELTLGVSKEDSKCANLSESHAKRWDQIEKEYTHAVSNINTPAAFDPARPASTPGSNV